MKKKPGRKPIVKGEMRGRITLSVGSDGASAIRELASLEDRPQGEVVTDLVFRELKQKQRKNNK